MEKTAYEEYVAGKDMNLTADSDSVKSYLADMGNIELLSASDENRLSERILRGQCVLSLKKEQNRAEVEELDENGAAFLLEKAHLLLCGITDLIPYVGPYIGGAVAVIVGFAESPFIGFLTLIVAIVVQLVENNILQPIVMSKTMKLHPVTIIVGLLIFEHFFGIVGMILATPIMSVIKVILEFIIEKFELFQRKNEEEKAI